MSAPTLQDSLKPTRELKITANIPERTMAEKEDLPYPSCHPCVVEGPLHSSKHRERVREFSPRGLCNSPTRLKAI